MSILHDIVLTEAAKKYLKLFEPIEPYIDMGKIQTVIDWTIHNFKREDRIIWYLRFVRLGVTKNNYFLRTDTDTPSTELYAGVNKWQQKETKRLSSKMRIREDILHKHSKDSISEWSGVFTNFDHFMAMVSLVPEIDAYIFEWQSPEIIIRDLFSLENEWRDRKEGKGLTQRSEHDVLIKFPDGSAWFNLNASSCDEEATAMGHCGNTHVDEVNETIFSLRSPVGDNKWMPHLTFILDEFGYLGEMKGRGNAKPAKKYHPYIIELLRNKYVTGIKGGGYLPENNFSIRDLKKNIQQELLAEKPQLLPMKERLEESNYSPKVIEEVIKDMGSDFSLHSAGHGDKTTVLFLKNNRQVKSINGNHSKFINALWGYDSIFTDIYSVYTLIREDKKILYDLFESYSDDSDLLYYLIEKSQYFDKNIKIISNYLNIEIDDGTDSKGLIKKILEGDLYDKIIKLYYMAHINPTLHSLHNNIEEYLTSRPPVTLNYFDASFEVFVDTENQISLLGNINDAVSVFNSSAYKSLHSYIDELFTEYAEVKEFNSLEDSGDDYALSLMELDEAAFWRVLSPLLGIEVPEEFL